MTQDPIHLGRTHERDRARPAHAARHHLRVRQDHRARRRAGRAPGALPRAHHRGRGRHGPDDRERLDRRAHRRGADVAWTRRPVGTDALARPRWRPIPERADGRSVVVRPGTAALVDTDADRAARAVALVAEAALRLEPSRQEAYLQPDGTAIRCGPFSAQLLPGLEAHGRDVPVETARIVLALLGATLVAEGEELVVRFPRQSLYRAAADRAGRRGSGRRSGSAGSRRSGSAKSTYCSSRAAARAGLAGVPVDVVELGRLALRGMRRPARAEALDDAALEQLADRREQARAAPRRRAGRRARTARAAPRAGSRWRTRGRCRRRARWSRSSACSWPRARRAPRPSAASSNDVVERLGPEVPEQSSASSAASYRPHAHCTCACTRSLATSAPPSSKCTSSTGAWRALGGSGST